MHSCGDITAFVLLNQGCIKFLQSQVALWAPGNVIFGSARMIT